MKDEKKEEAVEVKKEEEVFFSFYNLFINLFCRKS